MRRDDDACALCDKYREDEKEREADNEKEHDEMKSAISAAAKKEEVKELKEAAKSHISTSTFLILFTIAVGFVGWVAVDHIGMSRIVSSNTEIIKNHTEYIKEYREIKKVFYDNQVALMVRFGVDPKPLPEPKSK